MTESEWLRCREPMEMLRFLQGGSAETCRISKRKLRLAAPDMQALVALDLASRRRRLIREESEWDQELRIKTRWAEMLRDVCGPLPFRSVSGESFFWKDPRVVALAEKIYGDNAFDRMPELAKALNDAGCEDEEILAHCREPGPHVRGCWVVDFALGKS